MSEGITNMITYRSEFGGKQRSGVHSVDPEPGGR